MKQNPKIKAKNGKGKRNHKRVSRSEFRRKTYKNNRIKSNKIKSVSSTKVGGGSSFAKAKTILRRIFSRAS